LPHRPSSARGGVGLPAPDGPTTPALEGGGRRHYRAGAARIDNFATIDLDRGSGSRRALGCRIFRRWQQRRHRRDNPRLGPDML